METTAAAGESSGAVVAPGWRPPELVVVAVFALLSVWLTFSHLSRINTAIPGTAGDSLLNLWIVTHVQDSVLHGWRALWNAPIFFPAHDTLAYSESLFFVALVDWPFRLLFGPVVAFNLVHISASVIAAWTTYRLGLRYTRVWGAAFVGALVYAFAAARMTDLGHFQIVVGGALVPVVLLAFLRCLDRPSPLRAALFGLALSSTVLTASYDGALAGVLVAVVALGWVLTHRPHDWRRYVLAGGIALVVVGAVAGPFAYEYLRLQRQSAFHREFLPQMALHARDLFRVPARSLATHLPVLGPGFRSVNDGHPAFPGFVGIAAAIGGFIVVMRRSRDDLGRRRRELLLVLVAGALLVLLAFGDWQVVHGHRIPLAYGLVRHIAPGFSGLRALSRLALGGQLAIALLAAVGVDAILFARPWSWRLVGTIALAGIVCAEAITGVELTTVPTARDDYGIAEALRTHPKGVVAELPMQSARMGAAPWAYIEAPRQLEALRDGDPRVNGYSGFQPPRFDGLARTLNGFPDPQALAEARKLGVRYVVLRTQLIGDTPGSIRFVLGSTGSGKYTEPQVHRMISHLPHGVGRVVDHVAGGYVIELSQ